MAGIDSSPRDYFDALAHGEWERLERDAYARINFALHMDFLAPHIAKGLSVLDAGCGPGRFVIQLAQRGCRVTLADISPVQLALARQKLADAGLLHMAEGFHTADLRSMPMLASHSFDIILCYGAPLSYITENRQAALAEFHRLLKPGGMLITSVNNTLGIIRDTLSKGNSDFFTRPDYWKVFEVLAGENLDHPDMHQPPRHFFSPEELANLIISAGFGWPQLAASPCICTGNRDAVNRICQDPAAFETVRKIERMAYSRPENCGLGEFLLAKAAKKAV